MNDSIKKIIAIIGSAFLLFLAVYGSILPWRKSADYIQALQSLQSVKSLDQFESTLAKPMNDTSPVGQEELVRNTGSVVLNVLQSSGAQNPQIIPMIINYITSYYKPILDYGRGMSFGQNLYLLGAMNELAFSQTHDPKYLEAAKNYFLQGNAAAPERPQFLYGLFDVYRSAGDVSNTIAVAQKILTLWPTDTGAKQGLQQFLATLKTATTTKK